MRMTHRLGSQDGPPAWPRTCRHRTADIGHCGRGRRRTTGPKRVILLPAIRTMWSGVGGVTGQQRPGTAATPPAEEPGRHAPPGCVPTAEPSPCVVLLL